MATIISIVNGKGGVGKTASTVNLSVGLALQGYRVLVMDLDKQSNTTKHFKAYNPKMPSICNIALDRMDPKDVIRKTDIENVDIIPANYDCLEDLPDKILLDLNRSREMRLKPIENLDYDYIVIDCPPDLAILTINALTISDYVLVPIKIDEWGLEGFDKITAKMQMVRDEYNPRLRLMGAFVTMDNNTTVNKEMKKVLKDKLKNKFLDTSIRQTTKFVESTFYKVPVIIYSPDSTVSKDYISLTKEVIRYVK